MTISKEVHRFNRAVECADHFLGSPWEWATPDMLIEELLRQGKLSLANELRAAAWAVGELNEERTFSSR